MSTASTYMCKQYMYPDHKIAQTRNLFTEQSNRSVDRINGILFLSIKSVTIQHCRIIAVQDSVATELMLDP